MIRSGRLCRSGKFVPAIGLACALAIAVPALSGTASQLKPSRDPARALALATADGFTVAAAGDLIIARPIPVTGDPTSPVLGAVRILQAADVTFGNFEGSAIDIRNFKGYPAAEFGGMWLIGAPEVAKNLKDMGFDVLSRANNHTTDWGVEGMRETSRVLDAAGLVHAGSGETRSAARAARYVNTDKGRVAVVSMASSFTPLSRAMDPLGEAPGRPGLNPVRTTRYNIVTREMMEALRKIREAQPRGSTRVPPNENPDELQLFGTWYRVGDRPGFTYQINEVDEREILKSIRLAKENSDFVIATIHAHDPGNWSQEPADFLPKLAKAAIDNGADQFIGHGPHQLRGIEIYKGKPIFYSLGNYIFELNLQEPVAPDLYEQFNTDPKQITDAEFNEAWRERGFTNEVFYQSVIAVSRFERGQVVEIKLHPVDLGLNARDANRGSPRLATPAVAQTILERLQRLSEPFGTGIVIEGNVGVIRVPLKITSKEAR